MKPYPLCLGNISKDVIVNKMRKTGLNVYAYNYSVDCNAIEIGNIVGISNICLNYLSKYLLQYWVLVNH